MESGRDLECVSVCVCVFTTPFHAGYQGSATRSFVCWFFHPQVEAGWFDETDH